MAVAGWLLGAAPLAAAPQVVATILPAHALVADVMEGIAEPVLLLPPGSSPHGYQLRPSNAAALADADLIVWVGEGLETFLVRPLATLGGDTQVLELMAAPGMVLLEARTGGVWAEGHAVRQAHDHRPERLDPHIWLSPANAATIVDTVAAALAEVDPGNAATYASNATSVRAELQALDLELRHLLEPVRARPFIVAHDAFQYLEQAYGLNGVGSIAVSPDRPPGARRLTQLRDMITARGAACVFTEPQFRDGLAQMLVDGTSARGGVLDPEGLSTWQRGRGTYLEIMRFNGRALAECLAP